MILENINPFVRRAFCLMRAPLNQTVKSADCRLFYILEGDGTITVNETEYQFEKDSVCLWPSGTEYCWKPSKNNNCKLAIVNFDYTHEFRQKTEMIPLINKSNFDNCTILKSDNFTDAVALNAPIFLKNMHLFKNKTLSLIDEFESQKMYSSELASSMLKQLIINIVRHASSPSHAHLKIEPILEYIRLNYDKEITNSMLADIANYHPYYVNNLMKSYTGTTLHSYLIDYRLGEALKILLNTDESIESIALKTGFKNSTHFSNSFKKKYGSRPSEYRQSSKVI